MREDLTFVRQWYGLLLTLFPRSYRHEYGEELQMVFNLSLVDAADHGNVEIVRVLLRELIGLPRAILYEHLREGRKKKMSGKFASRFDFSQGSKSEFLAMVASFMIPLAAILFTIAVTGFFGVVPADILWLNILFAVVFFGSFLSVFVMGLKAGSPRWFLPFLGFILALINIYSHNGWIDPTWQGFPALRLAPEFVTRFVYEGLRWVGLIVLIILLVFISALVPKFRPFYLRLRDDWTLLTFVVYGMMPFAIFLTFDDYQNEGLYVLTANAILAIGGWFYLRSNHPWKRFGILLIGLTFALVTAAVGKAVLYDSPISSWMNEILSDFVTWLWLALIMLVTFAINGLPQVKSRPHRSDAAAM